jgi:hypothetical protein
MIAFHDHPRQMVFVADFVFVVSGLFVDNRQQL